MSYWTDWKILSILERSSIEIWNLEEKVNCDKCGKRQKNVSNVWKILHNYYMESLSEFATCFEKSILDLYRAGITCSSFFSYFFFTSLRFITPSTFCWKTKNTQIIWDLPMNEKFFLRSKKVLREFLLLCFLLVFVHVSRDVPMFFCVFLVHKKREK